MLCAYVRMFHVYFSTNIANYDDNGNDRLSDGVIAGIVTGIIVAVGVVIIIIILYYRKIHNRDGKYICTIT